MAFAYIPFKNGENTGTVRKVLNNVGDETERISNNANLSLGAMGTNVSIPISAWEDSTIYENFPYQATITLSGVLATDIPMVLYSAHDQESGNYIGGNALENGIRIYAGEIPSEAMTIPLVFTFREVDV